jgi:hypothetical protein
MVMKKSSTWIRRVALGFRVLLVGVCLAGVIFNFNMVGWGGALDLLSYYTLQSNIIVLLFFAGVVVYMLKHQNQTPVSPYFTIKGAVTICITLTFLVYHFILRPTLFSMTANTYGLSPANLVAHYVVPLMVIADWLLFDQKRSFKVSDPLKWTVIPLAYLVFALVRAQFVTSSLSGSRYPYFFIDLDKYSVLTVATNVIMIAFGYIALGYVIYLIDLALAKIAVVFRKPRQIS